MRAEEGRAPAFDKDMVRSAPSTLNLSNSIVPSTSNAAPPGEAAPRKRATPRRGVGKAPGGVGAGTAQKNSPGDRLNADRDVGASGRVEGQARPQVPEAERELVAPSLAMRCQRCGRVIPARERPAHAARCHVGCDEHEARRWGPI